MDSGCNRYGSVGPHILRTFNHLLHWQRFDNAGILRAAGQQNSLPSRDSGHLYKGISRLVAGRRDPYEGERYFTRNIDHNGVQSNSLGISAAPQDWQPRNHQVGSTNHDYAFRWRSNLAGD